MHAIYRILKGCKTAAGNLQIFYEARIAPFLALRLEWLFRPLYKLLVGQNICFVVNIGDVTGHIIIELDNFFRKVKTGQAPAHKRYVWLRKNTALSRACVKAYRHKFWLAISNNFIYNLFFPIVIRYKDITLDCGISRLKWQLPDDMKYHKTKYGDIYWYLQISKAKESRQHKEYYRLRSLSRDYFPLLETIYTHPGNRLIDFLKGKTAKLALIHIKTSRVNACAEPTDPQTYLPVLGYLLELGYQLVFVGRERMPQEFLRYGMINYANSELATFRHDIQLFKLAEIAVTAASGISCLADCLNKPYLYLNSWQLPFLVVSERCVVVPCLIQRESGEFLKFLEQIDLYTSSSNTDKLEVFSGQGYKARNATGEEILAAMQEVFAIKDMPTAPTLLQGRFKELTRDYPYYLALSRISEYFLNKHSGLF